MAAPVKPSDFEALIVTENDSICVALVNLGKLAYLWFKLARWILDETIISQQFAADLCNIECPDDPETPPA